MYEDYCNRVLRLLVCLVLSAMASRRLGHNMSYSQQPNDTLSDQDLAQLNRYPKASTQLSSVSLDPVISYLKLSDGQTADLPISGQTKLNQRLDYTVMFWFMVNTLPESGTFMQIFSIQKSLSCFVDSQQSIQCDSVGIQPLRVYSDQIVIGKWNHLTVSFMASSQTAYLMLQDDNGVQAISYSKDASIVQTLGQWSACFGMCIQKRTGFIGGIREFLAKNSYVLPEKATLAKNLIARFSPDIKAYFRFQFERSIFSNDQFVSRSFYWRTGAENKTIEDWRGSVMIPENVCPQALNYTAIYRFDLAQQMRIYPLPGPAKVTKYSYQMVITFMNNGTSCYSSNINSAQNGCNLVLLEGVFMLYFQSANMAKFFFFATKNFYQTQSPAFFVPNNQWITIKLFMSQQNGYQIYLIDQNDNVLSQYAYKYDMQQQSPQKQLYLFQSLVGYVSKFVLSDEVVKSQNAQFMPISPVVKLDFKAVLNSNGQYSADIVNRGRNKNAAQLMFFPEADLVSDPTNQLKTHSIFDGITCNDGHQVISLDYSHSYLNFTTSPLEFVNNTQNISIEFWFKFQNPASYNSYSQIFQMIDPYVDPFEHNYTYWVIYLNSSQLNIAPFGLGNQNESAVISFSEFSQVKEDTLGWWHVACAFQFNVSIQCFLSNSQVKISSGYSMVNVVKAFPTYSLDAHFGYYKSEILAPVRMLLKEVRVWKKVLTQDYVESHKHLQVDPTFDDQILVYLRLNSLKNVFFNVAQLNRNISFDCSGDSSLVSQVPDVTQIKITRYNYNTGMLEIASESQSHVVCPSYTYLRDQLCYSQPVNEVVLAVFPIWDTNKDKLSWSFTLKYSSLLQDSFFDFLSIQWTGNDIILNRLFNQNQQSQQVQPEKLRQESIYEITAAVSNPVVSFYTETSIKFIPNSCQWFEVDGFDAVSAYLSVLEMPGESDLSFSLSLHQNATASCTHRHFYDSFHSMSFNFYVSGSAQRIGVQPKVSYTLNSPSNQSDIPSASDLTLNVTILASELAQLPTFTDVRILMRIQWTSSDYADVIELTGSATVFQHALYTVNFQTTDSSLLSVNLRPKNQVVAINQTLILDASNVSTRNIDLQFTIVAYSWQCPPFFALFCSKQSGNNLTLPWQVYNESDAPFDTNFQFQVTVALVKDGQVIFLTTATSQVIWYNIMKPEFDVDFHPRPILASNPRDVYFTIVSRNFNQSSFKNFTIQWQVFGQLAGRQSISFQNLSQVMMVPSDSWKTNSSYSVSCTLTYTQSEAIQTNTSFVVNIYGQPFGGLIYVSPRQGYIGDNFYIYLQGWESYLDTSTIVYTVFSSLDELGNQIGQQLTQKPMFQNETFFYKAQSIFPLIVKISDITGETTTSRVAGMVLNQTNPALDQQTLLQRFFSGLGLRHLSVPEFETQKSSQVNFECQFSRQYDRITDLSNETTCRSTEVFAAVREVINSSCTEGATTKQTAIIEIFDSLVGGNGSCAKDSFLLISLLDLLQSLPAQENSVQVMTRARSIIKTENFSGTSVQVSSLPISSVRNGTQKLLGVSYQPTQQTCLDLTGFEPTTYLQLIVVKSNEYASLALLQIFQPELQQVVSFKELSGQIKLTFDVIPELYLPNITVCAVVSLNDNSLSVDSCLTKLYTSLFEVTCTCNVMMFGEVVTLTHDYSRLAGASASFPNHQITVFASGILHINKSSYIFIAIIGTISLYGLIGFAFALKMDKNDKLLQEQTEESKKHGYIEQISIQLGRSPQLIRLQMQELMKYRTIELGTVFHVAKAISPFLSPFTYFNASQSRILRFCTFHTQVNILVIMVLMYYGHRYRESGNRFEEVLDLADIQSVSFTIVFGCIFLLPVIADKCNQLCENRPGKAKRFLMLGLVYTLSFLLNFTIILVAVFVANQAPASNQYLISVALTGSLVGSSIIINTARVLFNSYKATEPFSYLQSIQARTIHQEIDCMRKIELPSGDKQQRDCNQFEVMNTESELRNSQGEHEQASIELTQSQVNDSIGQQLSRRQAEIVDFQSQKSESRDLYSQRNLNDGFRE